MVLMKSGSAYLQLFTNLISVFDVYTKLETVSHAGVLVPTKDKKLLFVEKLSFSLPYQVLKFDNRKQLKNYLMGMYDTSWGQEEAKPFIMENTKTAL